MCVCKYICIQLEAISYIYFTHTCIYRKYGISSYVCAEFSFSVARWEVIYASGGESREFRYYMRVCALTLQQSRSFLFFAASTYTRIRDIYTYTLVHGVRNAFKTTQTSPPPPPTTKTPRVVATYIRIRTYVYGLFAPPRTQNI